MRDAADNCRGFRSHRSPGELFFRGPDTFIVWWKNAGRHELDCCNVKNFYINKKCMYMKFYLVFCVALKFCGTGVKRVKSALSLKDVVTPQFCERSAFYYNML